MHKRIWAILVASVATVALAAGGIALAQGGHHGKGHHAAKHAANKAQTSQGTTGTDTSGATHGDNVQQGDQNAPDTGGPGENASGNASEKAGENGPSDGPGGFADSSSSADTQQTGEH